jgi:tRNA threonylcarbamoyl adenosine modification protein YeaZ
MTSSAPSSASRPDLVAVLGAAEERLHLVIGRDVDGELVLEMAQEWRAPMRAMALLAPSLHAALSLLGGPGRLKGLACVRGPGSFSGLRVVLSFAEGMKAGLGLPLGGLSHLHVLALSAPKFPDGTLAVVTHARRGLVHVQAFFAPSLDPLCDVRVLSVPEAIAAIEELPGPVRVLGSGLRRNAQAFAALATSVQTLDQRFDHPLPEALLEAARLATFSLDPVEPLYVRPSDAEENLPQIAAGRGLSPDEAARMLEKARLSAQKF